MHPNNAISLLPVPANLLSPDDEDVDRTQSLEYGGVAVNDASQGRLVQVWRAWIDGLNIKFAPQPANTPITTFVTAVEELTSVSLAFDAAMQPTVCYVEGGLLKLKWFNTLTATFQTDSFPGATSGLVSADDKRPAQESQSDVLFAYTKDGQLFRRWQRERYLTPHVVGAVGLQVLKRIGMSTNNRFQYETMDLP